LKRVLEKSQLTTIYVTHDQEEAYALADRIVVMDKGRVVQVGSPQTIYRHPVSRFVARFLGLNNLLNGEIREMGGGLVAETPIGAIPFDGEVKGQVTLLLRPDAVQLDSKGEFTLSGRLVAHTFRGSTSRIVIEVEGFTLTFEFPSNLKLPKVGETVCISFDPHDAIQILD
jgi:ABC-type Fe3+/spermidine/putrescine transport system ATPase subunit